MCGIYGFIGKPTKKTGDILRGLGILNQERGTDSTGIVMADETNVTLLKRVVNATQFYNDPKIKKTISNYSRGNYLLAIGHTRMATRGAVNHDNAHPYRIGSWILAHNGVINNFDTLQAKYGTKYEVDSQIIGYLLNIHDQKTVFEKDITGMFATPHFKYNDPFTLYIAKNDAPVSFWTLPDKRGMYFSSTKAHMDMAGKAVGLLGNSAMGGGSKLYTFKWVHGQIEREKIKLNTPKIQYIWNYPRGGWLDGYDFSGSGYDYQTPKIPAKKLTPAGFWHKRGGYLIQEKQKEQKWEKSEENEI